MALISCVECSTQVSDRAAACPSCGCPIAPAAAVVAAVGVQPPTVALAKSRGVYIILGLLFGGFGFHNFYSGHFSRGGIKVAAMIVTLVMDLSTGFSTGFSMVAFMLIGIWCLVEIVTVKADATGTPMR